MRVPWNRAGIRSYLLLIGLMGGHPTFESIAVGTVFFLVGLGLRIWAKGCLHQRQEVTACGPYRYVRHPFYLGNAMVDLGIVLMSGWDLLVVIFPLWWCVVYMPVIRREEKVMKVLFGSAYEDYSRKVPCLIPYRRPIPSRGKFSWRNQNVVGTEIHRSLRLLSYPLFFLALFVCEYRGLFLHYSPNWLVGLPLAGAMLLNALAWWWKNRWPGRETGFVARC